MMVLHCIQSRCINVSCKTYYEITDKIREELIESQVITFGEHSRQRSFEKRKCIPNPGKTNNDSCYTMSKQKGPAPNADP